jgi:diguanylate cyclase (GGDEF)-like protein
LADAVPVLNPLHRGLRRLADPAVVFPVTAMMLLTVIWTATVELIKLNRSDAEHVAAGSSQGLLDTYEAQVVRALGEIDQTLNLVKYWHETGQGHRSLADLKDRGLLPPELLFTVSVAGPQGVIVDSTLPDQERDISGEDYFRAQRESDTLVIGRVARGRAGDSVLHFSRRLDSAHGAFDGAVVVAVDSAYFVSGYDAAKLGEHGVLAIAGTDGIMRVRRTGESDFSGDVIDYAAVVTASPGDTDTAITTSSWDGVRRWTRAREIYGFPLAVLVGLSVEEQLATSRRETLKYLWRAGWVSVLVIVLAGLLGRMSWLLGRAAVRERDASVAHAERIEYLAFHDGLTGLPNRSMFTRLLSLSIAEAHRYNRTLAVAFLDLDRFKQINDSLGHEAGDQLLQEVAARLHSCLRESDTVARLGGDEFVVLLPELASGTGVALVAQKILAAVSRPFTLIGQEFRITASIGISTFPQDGVDEQTLTKHADVAMYQAKTEGKNNFRFYSEAQNVNSLERFALESGLRHALARDEFRVVYQAKRDIGSGRVTGMEALLRWQHPDLGVIEPVRFISVAEESGLIVPIGKWVLKTACLQNIAWQKRGLPPLSIAVNMTARQFYDERLIADVTSILKITRMDPNLLELEFTEALLIQDVEETLRILSELKAMRIRIAIDDFGIGYSSLATLQRFPLDTIKIDRTLIRDISGASAERGLANAIIAMGKSLSVTVVAQGVETREQADFLRVHACDELQGFYFERPLPADETTKLLLAQATEITYVGERLGLNGV